MTVLEISLIISQAITGAGFIGLVAERLYKELTKKPQILTETTNNVSPSMPSLGMSTEAYESAESTDDYLKRLRKMYPDAYANYKNEKAKISKTADRYVLLLIGKINSGELSVTDVGAFTMQISNGDQIWVGNRWYGFGTLYRCPESPHLQFTYPDGKVGEHAFLSLVDLYYKNLDFTEWRKKTNKHLGITHD